MDKKFRIKVFQTSSGRTKYYHTFFTDTPLPGSIAELVMLNDHYLQQDEDHIMTQEILKGNRIFIALSKRKKKSYRNTRKYDRLLQATFNWNWLDKVQKEKGHLQCAFCGKDHLVLYPFDAKEKVNAIMATADHFIPISKGGPSMDETNLVVACWKCNNAKKNIILPKSSLKFYEGPLLDSPDA